MRGKRTDARRGGQPVRVDERSARGDDHPVHPVAPLEAVGLLERETALRRRRDDEPRLVDALAEQLRERFGLPHREARPERQHLDEERGCDDLALASSDAPTALVDVLRVEIGERIGGQEPVPFEERAHIVGRSLQVELDIGQQRGRGHDTSRVGARPSGAPPLARRC